MSTDLASSLCHMCMNIFDNWGDAIKYQHFVRFQHCGDIFALKASAARGCPLCGQFYRNLESRGEETEICDATIDVLNNGRVPVPGQIKIISFERIISDVLREREDCWLMELCFRVARKKTLESDQPESPPGLSDLEMGEEDASSDSSVTLDPDGLADFDEDCYDKYTCKAILLPSIVTGSGSTSSNRTSKLSTVSERSEIATLQFKTWLASCENFHGRCKNSQRSLPTRLLLLESMQFKLCSTSEIRGLPRYATLSHCWGSLKILKLTTKNLHILKRGMPFHVLCKTFREAAIIARELGLQYLWIDSLCIIQDDSEDWNKESKLMAGVYGSSTINIAATSAADGTMGCFFNKDPAHVWSHHIVAKVGPEEKYYDCVEDGIAERCLEQTPLASRAWVIQERLLAPRTLHFSSMQVFWECNEVTACETFPEKLPAPLTYGDFYLHKQPISLQLWPKIVRLYSTCNLTFERDKLIAISGIARAIYNQIGDEYVAGLWKGSMEVQLCWKVRSPSPKLSEIRAPSWSWANVDGTVSLPPSRPPETGEDLVCKVMAIDLLEHDTFGEVPAAWITLRCDYMIPCELLFKQYDSRTYLMQKGKLVTVTVNLDFADQAGVTAIIAPITTSQGLLLSKPGSMFRSKTRPSRGFERIGHVQFHVPNLAELDRSFSGLKLPFMSDYVEQNVKFDGGYIISVQ